MMAVGGAADNRDVQLPTGMSTASRDRLALLAAFLIPLAFYLATLAPTVIWGDSAAFARMVIMRDYGFGTASDHPLYIAIGRLLHAGLPVEVALALNLESALFAALAVMFVYRIGRQLGAAPLAAGVGAAALAVSHAFWLHAVVAEVYAPNAFFVAATISLLLQWRKRNGVVDLGVALGVFALGLTNHLVLAGLAPAIGTFIVLTKRDTLLTLKAALIAAVLVAVVVVAALLTPPAAAALRHVWYGPPSIGDYFRLSVDSGVIRELGYYLLLLVYQFPSVALLLGLIGAVSLLRSDRDAGVLLLLALGVNALFFIHHTEWTTAGTTKFVFYISDYVVFAVWCGLGADRLARRLAAPDQSLRPWAIAMLLFVSLMPPAVYSLVPAMAERFGKNVIGGRQLPYRDNQRFFLNPNKHGEDGARRYGVEALQRVKPNAVIFADSTPYEVLRYLQLNDGMRPDVLVRSPVTFDEPVMVRWLFVDGMRRPTYLAARTSDYNMRGLTGRYEIVRDGPIFEVRPN